MKKTLTILASFLLVIGFNACSGSDSSSNETVVEAMVIGQEYTLAIGDEINKVTADATIDISQNSEDNETKYTLVFGEATITHQ